MILKRSFKHLLTTGNRGSTSQEAGSTATSDYTSAANRTTIQSQQQQSEPEQDRQQQSQQQQTQKQNEETLEAADDEELIDPTQIPMRVRKSLLDMHYHLHMKPPMLQTSRISKSDSNIKVSPHFNPDGKNMKLFSLQKSSYD